MSTRKCRNRERQIVALAAADPPPGICFYRAAILAWVWLGLVVVMLPSAT